VSRRVQALAPETPVGVLSTSYLIDNAAAVRAAGARDLWQHWSMIDAALVRDAHAAGARVIAWTVNDVEVAHALAGEGVDGLCTDLPGALRAAFPRATS
jgi:glycerophosphoryl diester phosphodiesterase